MRCDFGPLSGTMFFIKRASYFFNVGIEHNAIHASDVENVFGETVDK